MQVRGIVATLFIAIAGLLGVGATGGRSDPPARPKPAVLVSAPSEIARDAEARAATVDVDAVYAYYVIHDEARRVREYLDARHADDLALAAWVAAHPPAPSPRPASSGYTNPAPSMGSCNGDFECFKPCTFGHESGGNYQIVSPGGTYRGAWQFDQGTWNNAVANAGYPEWVGRPANEAPPEIQDAAAAWLYSMRGNQPWGGRC